MIFRHVLFLVALSANTAFASASEFDTAVKPLLAKYCSDCHSGETPNGNVDFAAITSDQHVVKQFDALEKAIGHLQAKTMPPKDEDQPTDFERAEFFSWYEAYIANIDVRPAEFQPRRLSVDEYRNTLRSVFGFDLRVAIIEAEQTLAERSLIRKLLPVDPPGESGFKNDTHRNPLTSVTWDQYSYLADAALERLFSLEGRTQLQRIVGPIDSGGLNSEAATKLLQTFAERTRRRSVGDGVLKKTLEQLADKQGEELTTALKFELKTLLMSPAFIYRGLLSKPQTHGRQTVDDFELAERLSYFLWADMPDDQLRQLAADGKLTEGKTIVAEIDRMLASKRARSLAEVFATEWFTLNEIEFVNDNPPQMLALKSQPIDFMNYLFTENRPLLELVDSKTTFINPHTARMYGPDARQLQRPKRQKGIEVAAYENQKITLNETTTRGGLLTMAGVLSMNKGPIQRGTWILERILGEQLPEPPPDVGQVAPNRGDEKLSFRERFEQHRSNETCAVCHDKIDPLGFVMQTYDARGNFVKAKNYKPSKRDVRKGLVSATPESSIDTSGQLPTGETFNDIAGLKQILQTTQRKVVIRNIVERTMSYALCRKLMIYDRPTVESITETMASTNGTWRDLFVAIANSVPFRETIRE